VKTTILNKDRLLKENVMNSYKGYKAVYHAVAPGTFCLRGRLTDKDDNLLSVAFLAHISELQDKFKEAVDGYLLSK
jgi:hypothetical protein